jgi:hypothetical protein
MDTSDQLHALAILIPGEMTLVAHWIGGWVDPRDGLEEAMAKRKIFFCPCQELNPGH